MCNPAVSTSEIDSANPPCICASMPLGLMGLPTSMAIVARVTLTLVRSRASISTMQATKERVSWCTAAPCANPAGIDLQHSLRAREAQVVETERYRIPVQLLRNLVDHDLFDTARRLDVH